MADLPELIDFHRRLVDIQSVNPEFGDTTGEADLVDFLVAEAAQRGVTLLRQEVFPGRDNLYARIGPPDQPALLLDAHLDTVAEPPGGMEIPDRESADREERTYGRGSSDTKAALAVFFTLFCEWAKAPEKLPYPVVFSATIDEECRQTGAFRLMEVVGPLAGAIAGEPTNGNIIHAHKGSYRATWQARGKASHSALPHLGDSAIFRMADSLVRLRELANSFQSTTPDPDLGHPTLNVGIIEGGSGVNMVPDQCTIYIDRRVLPSEDHESVKGQIEEAVTGGDSSQFRMIEDRFRSGIRCAVDHPFAQALAQASTSVKGSCEFLRAPYMTNATAFEAAGVPSLVFGPGTIETAHTKDEYLEWPELIKIYRTLQELLRAGDSWIRAQG